jgi:hypothetical protein
MNEIWFDHENDIVGEATDVKSAALWKEADYVATVIKSAANAGKQGAEKAEIIMLQKCGYLISQVADFLGEQGKKAEASKVAKLSSQVLTLGKELMK